MQYKNSYKIVKINEKDFKILSCLFKYENSVCTLYPTFLAAITKIPRTTIEFRLKELQARSLCTNQKSGRERIWKITDIGRSILLEGEKKESRLETLSGMEAIHNYLESLLGKKGVGRLYGIEPSLQVSVYQKKNYSTNASQLRLLQLFKKYEHVAETVTSEDTLKTINLLPKKTLREMLGRATVVTIVPNKYITFKDYIVCYLGKTLFFDFEKEECVIVHDNKFTESVISIVKNLQIFGQKINLNQYIQNLLQEKM